jgi:tRNA-Thr(GGU) m(6)t(6)A37 methyltransferase TsaA
VNNLASEEYITFKPIGIVKTSASGHQVRDKNIISQLILKSQYTEALSGLSDFSHIFVLFHLNQVTKNQPPDMKVHPRARQDMPLTGLFATRTMMRPNPIGLSLVELLKVEDNVLTVRGLDAYDGSPVLDVKPYDPWDCVADARVADWWKKLAVESQSNSLTP